MIMLGLKMYENEMELFGNGRVVETREKASEEEGGWSLS